MNRSTRAPIPFYGSIVAELQRRRPVLCVLLLSALTAGLAHSALALAAGSLARGLAGAGEPQAPIGSLGNPWSWTLQQSAYFGLGAALVKGLATTSLAYWETSLSHAVGQRLRRNVLAYTLRHGAPAPAPDLLAALGTRVAQVEQAVTYGAIRTVRGVAQLVPLCACLIWMSPILAAGAGVAFGLVGVGLGRSRARFRKADEAAQRLAEATHCQVDALVNRADLWRTYGAVEAVASEVATAASSAGRAESRVRATRAALSSANEVLAAAALVLAIAWTMKADVNLAELHVLEFAAVFFMAYRPLRDLSDSRSWTVRGRNALDSLAALGGHVSDAPRRKPIPNWCLEALRLERFGHAERGARLSAELEPGAMLCLVGPNGAGKTTLLRSLLGLDPTTGKLTYGAQPLESAPAGPADRPFAWVPQEAPLVTGTVIDNVCLVGVTRAAAWKALLSLGHASVLTLARASALVGPRGRAVSGGERRIIALARALATDLPVLLIDEPTSELDASAARDVRAALTTLRGHRSAIIVTHDPLVTHSADRVVELAPPAAQAAE